MTPIYKEYIQFLRDMSGEKLEFLEQGYYWLDNQIIKCFDKNGNIYKICRIQTDEQLKIKF